MRLPPVIFHLKYVAFVEFGQSQAIPSPVSSPYAKLREKLPAVASYEHYRNESGINLT